MSTETKEKKAATPKQLANLAKARAVRDQNRARAAEDMARSFVATPSAVDAEARSQQIADEARGVIRTEIKPPPPAYVDPAGDADLQSHLIAIQKIEEELRKERALLAARQANRGESYREQDRGRAPVEMRVAGWAQLPSPLDPVEDDGSPLPEPPTADEVVRWIRVKESPNDTADNTFRLRTFTQTWKSRILKKKNGEPCRTGTLMAVATKIESNAMRILRAAPPGVFDTAKPMDRLREVAEDVNMEYGRRHHGALGGVLQVDGGEVTTTATPVHPFAPE